MMRSTPPVGTLLRDWRRRRRLSQLDLALHADVSARHISFLETGRSHPSREMLLHLAEQLDVPLRDRNALLQAAGFAPVYTENGLDDPELRAAREAIQLVLNGHEPYPALAIDRHWNLAAANRAVAPLLAGVKRELFDPPLNVLRMSLHPAGLAPRIANLPDWRRHVLARLQHQIDQTADPILVALHAELRDYPLPPGDYDPPTEPARHTTFVIPLRLRTERGTLSFLSTTTVFGTAVDITLSELAIESFFPADEATGRILREVLRATT